jgi:hypothetical protein
MDIMTKLPTEIVHLIMLFTGKFKMCKNGKIKSIICVDDFENIRNHLTIFKLSNKYAYANMQKFVKYLHKKIYNRPVMDERERKLEELKACVGIDYHKHSWLFLKESPIEEVMIPCCSDEEKNEVKMLKRIGLYDPFYHACIYCENEDVTEVVTKVKYDKFCKSSSSLSSSKISDYKHFNKRIKKKNRA